MEKEIIKMNKVIHGVKFMNLPLIIDPEKGTVGYPLTSLAIAEEIADGIAEYAKGSVTVDFDTVDRTAMMQRLNRDAGVSSDESIDDAEAQLLSFFDEPTR